MVESNDSMADADTLEGPESEAGGGDGSSPVDPSRRTFMARATVAMGGVIGAITAVPLVGYVFYPVGKKLVRSPDEPIEVAAVHELPPGGKPLLVAVNADAVRDAWSVSAAPLGAVWLRKLDKGGTTEVQALSATCPHLGCSVGYDEDAKEFLCPCHKSVFALDGEKKSGPAKRGMDPLTTEIKNGRVTVRYKKFRSDVPDREEV